MLLTEPCRLLSGASACRPATGYDAAERRRSAARSGAGIQRPLQIEPTAACKFPMQVCRRSRGHAKQIFKVLHTVHRGALVGGRGGVAARALGMEAGSRETASCASPAAGGFPSYDRRGETTRELNPGSRW